LPALGRLTGTFAGVRASPQKGGREPIRPGIAPEQAVIDGVAGGGATHSE